MSIVMFSPYPDHALTKGAQSILLVRFAFGNCSHCYPQIPMSSKTGRSLRKITIGHFYLRDILKRDETSSGRSAIYIHLLQRGQCSSGNGTQEGRLETYQGGLDPVDSSEIRSFNFGFPKHIDVQIHIQQILPVYLSSHLFLIFLSTKVVFKQ